MKTIITLTGVLFVIGLFAFPHTGWATDYMKPGVYCQTGSDCSNPLVYGRVDIAPNDYVAAAPQPEFCALGDPCDDGVDCTDDFCSFKSVIHTEENPRGICQHVNHCGVGLPPPSPVEQPVPTPPPPPPPPPPPAVEPPAPPVVEQPVPPVVEQPAPPVVETPAPETVPSVALKFDCSASPEDTIKIGGRDVIFAIDKKGKRTHVHLEAVPFAEGSKSALTALLNGAEKIELTQTGGSELVLMKGADSESSGASLAADTVVIDATGTSGLVPTDFAFDSPIPVSPDWSGVETYSFTAKLVDGDGKTLADAVAVCPIGLQIKGGGGIGGCSLTNGEFEKPSLLGLCGMFLFAWGVLYLAEKFKRPKK